MNTLRFVENRGCKRRVASVKQSITRPAQPIIKIHHLGKIPREDIGVFSYLSIGFERHHRHTPSVQIVLINHGINLI